MLALLLHPFYSNILWAPENHVNPRHNSLILTRMALASAGVSIFR